jgi:hypothetical protein
MRRNDRTPKKNKAKLKIEEQFQCWHCKKIFARLVPKIGKHPYYAYCNSTCERADLSDDYHAKAVRLQQKLFKKAKRLHRQASSDQF